jgi:type VI secretion system protein ImpK
MNASFRDRVYAILHHALDLKRRLEEGHLPAPDLATEQRELIAILGPENEARRSFDFGGDGTVFLGARYALACWLDDLFILNSPWSSDWNAQKLETALYGTNNRAWMFWDQADLVLRRPGSPRTASLPGVDAMEAFLLCIVLGFRGKLLDEPAKVREYVEELRPQVTRADSWQSPADRGIRTNVEPLKGAAAVRRVVWIYGGLALGATLLLLIVYRLLPLFS